MKGQKDRQKQKADENFSKKDKAAFLEAAPEKGIGKKINIRLNI